MPSKPSTFFLLWTLSALLACTPRFGVQESGIETPETWNTLEDVNLDGPLVVDENAAVEQDWWKHFGDPVLDELLVLAVTNNKTLAIAQTRIEEAWAAQTAAWSILFPQISLLADAARGNQGFYTNGLLLSYQDVNIQANWEIDLFGKNRTRLRATTARIQSSQAMRQSVLVTLFADVARSYFDMRNYERQIEITKQNLESQERTLELVKEQFLGGLASDFDVQRTGAQVSTTESLLPAQQIAYAEARNRLSILLGSTPGEHDELFQTIVAMQPLDPHVVVAAPATVLATRPDVREAERLFVASLYDHEAANRELFPTISLASFYGVQWASIFNTAPTWNILGTLTQPLINFGEIESRIEATDARQLQAYLTYQQTVLEALEDMENALANYFFETSRNRSLTLAAEQNQKAMDLAYLQYTNGYTALLDVLVVQRTHLETESTKATSDAKLRKDLVNIYTSAGGGWGYEDYCTCTQILDMDGQQPDGQHIMDSCPVDNLLQADTASNASE